jgi:hypothetical protein
MPKATNKSGVTKKAKPGFTKTFKEESETQISAVSKSFSEFATFTLMSAPFLVQSSQIAMYSVEKMINHQTDALSRSFNDMQGLVEKQGLPTPETVNDAFRLIVDRSTEHVLTTIVATQEMRKTYLNLMERHLQTVNCPWFTN